MDREGRVKVWLNPDLSKCHSFGSSFTDDLTNLRQSERLEEQMVSEIIAVIEANTTEEIEPSMTFSDFLRHAYKGRGISFRQAKQELIKYAKKYETDIPNFFESVIGIFDEATENQSNPHTHTNHPEDSKKYYQESNDYEQFHKNPEEQQLYDHNYCYPRDRKDSGAKVEGECRTLERVPSNDNYADNYMRPATHMPTPTYLLSSNHQRAQSPIQQLGQPIQIGRINNTSLNVKFNYQSLPSSLPPHPSALPYPNPQSPISTVSPPAMGSPQRTQYHSTSGGVEVRSD